MVEMTITGSINELPLIEVRPMHQDLCSVCLFDQYKSSVVHSAQQHEYIMSITFLRLIDEELRVEAWASDSGEAIQARPGAGPLSRVSAAIGNRSSANRAKWVGQIQTNGITIKA